jgi:hypothetical protein
MNSNFNFLSLLFYICTVLPYILHCSHFITDYTYTHLQCLRNNNEIDSLRDKLPGDIRVPYTIDLAN